MTENNYNNEIYQDVGDDDIHDPIQNLIDKFWIDKTWIGGQTCK